jgi:hypothetical protein
MTKALTLGTTALTVKLNPERIIQGEQLKCVDGRWHLRNDSKDLTGSELLYSSSYTVLQHWIDDKHVEYKLELEEQDDLNDLIPRGQWRLGLNGKPRTPWEVAYIVYLLDQNAGVLTFINTTWGAQQAWNDLHDKVARMQALKGAEVRPMVRLESRPMKTDFGTKQRPHFEIVDASWRDYSKPAQLIDVTPEAAPQLAGTTVKEPSTREEFADDIPF